jgi:hypothetical protein
MRRRGKPLTIVREGERSGLDGIVDTRFRGTVLPLRSVCADSVPIRCRRHLERVQQSREHVPIVRNGERTGIVHTSGLRWLGIPAPVSLLLYARPAPTEQQRSAGSEPFAISAAVCASSAHPAAENHEAALAGPLRGRNGSAGAFVFGPINPNRRTLRAQRVGAEVSRQKRQREVGIGAGVEGRRAVGAQTVPSGGRDHGGVVGAHLSTR